MTSRAFPSNILEQAQSVLSAWKEIEQDKSYGTVTPDSLQNHLTQAAQLTPQLEALEAQLTNLRNQRDDLYNLLWDDVKRVRSGIKANYGDDSSQFEMIGGTRVSDRKPPTRKTPSAA